MRPAGSAYDATVIASGNARDWLSITDEPLPVPTALEWVGGSGWGGVACFLGTVREHAEGRQGVSAIEYEAYDAPALERFGDLAAEARAKWPDIGRVVVWHRTGLVRLGESSVAVVVSAPHRAEAFDACRYLIDTLKQTAPIWKREIFDGGAEWSPTAHPIEPVKSDAIAEELG